MGVNAFSRKEHSLASPNARLTFHSRLQIVRLHAAGHAPATIAALMGISRATIDKWLRRFKAEGLSGLGDRPSSPKRCSGKTSAVVVAAIRALRCERAWGPHRIGYALGMARSTVYAVLRRLGLHRLASLHRSTREVIRYERAAPGELVHLDVKKLGRIPDGGGKRFDSGFLENGGAGQGNLAGIHRSFGHETHTQTLVFDRSR